MNLPFGPSSLLAAYLRDSGGEEQELSVEQQKKAVLDWANEHGYIISNWFVDEARPGSDTIGREAFQEMISHFRSPRCREAGIVVWKFSRFARDLDDAQFDRADLRRRGYEVYSLHDNIPTGLDGRFFEAAIDWMNQRFLADLSTDVKRGLRHLVEQYGAVPGTPPKGFKREPINVGKRRDGSDHIVHRWVPDPDLVPAVKLAFEMKAAGATHRQVQEATGLYGSKNSWTTFFGNRLFIGELVFGDLVIKDYCDPIIDRATWEAVQSVRRMNEPAKRMPGPDNENHPRRKIGMFVFSGLLSCARCGSPLNGHVIDARKLASPRRYYACSRRKRRMDCDMPHFPKDELEAILLQEIKSVIISPANIEMIQEEIRLRQEVDTKSLETRRKEISRRLAGVRQRLSNVTRAIEMSGPRRSLVDRLAALEGEEGKLQEDLTQIEYLARRPAFLDVDPAEASFQLVAWLEEADSESLRAVLRGLVKKIVLDVEGNLLKGRATYYEPPVKKETPQRGDSYAYMRCPQGESNPCFGLERAAS
jgi:site-specific DNA recombinase